MNNQKEYDFLRELTVVDDEKISEIASKYPMPDKSALNRINALCEEKLAKKENDNKNIYENSEAENVEVICNIPWYRRPAFTAAACFAVLVGVTGGIMAVFSGKSDKDNIPDNPLLTVIETTTAQSAETTTDITEAAETTVQTVTTAIQTVTETSEQNDEDMEMPDLVGKSYESSKDEYKDYFQLIVDSYVYNDEYETGIIIEQSVNAGTTIDKGSAVKVTVSKGSLPENGEPPVDLPDEQTVDELIDALELIEALMSNGAEFDCDMDDNFTDESGQLYVKVTESGFDTIADVENFMNRYLTEEFINSRYKALTDRNSGKFIEKENGLYILYAPKAGGFNGVNKQDKAVIESWTDEGIIEIDLIIPYDNFGEPSTLVLHLVEVSEGNWKINSIATN